MLTHNQDTSTNRAFFELNLTENGIYPGENAFSRWSL